ncbi:class I SAM-dependent methyltransferase [Streptomyces sp. M19]
MTDGPDTDPGAAHGMTRGAARARATPRTAPARREPDRRPAPTAAPTWAAASDPAASPDPARPSARHRGPTTRAHRWHEPHDYERLTGQVQARNARLVAGLHPDPRPCARRTRSAAARASSPSSSYAPCPRPGRRARRVGADAGTRACQGTRRAGTADPRAFPEDAPSSHVPYDAVFSNAALHWLHPRLPAAFDRIAELLAPGGLLCAATAGQSAAAREFDAWVAERTAGLVPPDSGDVPFTERRLTIAGAERLARAAGSTRWTRSWWNGCWRPPPTATRAGGSPAAARGPRARTGPGRAAERLTDRFGGPGARCAPCTPASS